VGFVQQRIQLRLRQLRRIYVIRQRTHAASSKGLAHIAACTPHFFLYDRQRRLAYRGAFDESTPGNGKPVTGDLLHAAVEQVLAGKSVPEPHKPSMGCSIKWRS
jgi:hypothetical protein